MRQSLRRTLAHLQLAFGNGEASEALVGRRFMLESDGGDLCLSIDLTPNFQTRHHGAPGYVDAMAVARNHARLSAVQCDDTLVRTRLVRAWEAAQAAPGPREPRLRLVLDLGPRGRFTYAVRPHLLFTGGVQLDVLQVLDDPAPAPGAAEAV